MFYRLIIITMPKPKPFIKWEKFWRLTALWEHKSNDWGKSTFEKMQCECWIIKWINRATIRKWRTVSCWCYNRERSTSDLISYNKRHWLANTRIYNIYKWVKDRCTNINNPCYNRYWGRGIKCLWDTFDDFYRDMWYSYENHIKEYWKKDTTIERINNDWNYCKDNCKWATWREQCNNKNYTRYITYKWETLPIVEMCYKYWISADNVKYRLKAWWTVEDAIEKPKQRIFKERQEKEKQKSLNPNQQ